jgi:hypothetical protein
MDLVRLDSGWRLMLVVSVRDDETDEPILRRPLRFHPVLSLVEAAVGEKLSEEEAACPTFVDESFVVVEGGGLLLPRMLEMLAMVISSSWLQPASIFWRWLVVLLLTVWTKKCEEKEMGI